MYIKEIGSKKLQKEFSIDIPYSEIDDSINNKIKEIIPTVTLPGFRKGKAPINIVKKKYENNILGEVIEKIVQEKTKNLLEEKKLKPFRQPKVKIIKYKKNEPVELNVKIDIEPDFKICEFEKIKTINYKINIDDKSYKENIEKYIKSQNTYSKLKKIRPIKKGDKVFVNIISEDKTIPDFLHSQHNIPIITDSDYQVLPDISNILIKKKLKSGDNIKLKFDIKKVLKSNKQKLVEFSIEIKDIHEITEFKIDKEFLNKNNLKSEKEFIDKINQSLKNQYDYYLKEIEKKQLMDLLEINNKFDIHESIVDEEFNIIWKRVMQAKKDSQLDEDDKDLNDAKLKKRYEKIASRRVKLAILMQKIAEENTITVTEKELNEGMLNYVTQYPGQEKQIFDYFKKNPSQIESIKGPIFEKKIIDCILSKTKKENKTITIKEFNKLQEEAFSLKR